MEAATETVCAMCRPYIELDILEEPIGDGYVLLDVDECPRKAIRRYILERGVRRKRPRAEEEDVADSPRHEVHGVDCEDYHVFPSTIDCGITCAFCDHVTRAAVAEEVAAFLGGIKELGEVCADFLECPERRSETEDPVLTLPRTPDGEIDWDRVECNSTYRAPGPATRVVSKVGAFRPFTILRIFSLNHDQLLLRSALSDRQTPSEFVVWREPERPLPHILPLLNQALRKFVSRPLASDNEGPLRLESPFVDAEWNGYSARVMFKWDDETKTPFLLAMYFICPGHSWSNWDLNDGSEGPTVIARRAGPIDVTELDRHTCSNMMLGVRQGGWVYMLFYSEYAWLDGKPGHFYNLEALCETPPPRV
jgi:hypothetical protein